MKRILITGGTGFVGRSMLDYRLRHCERGYSEWVIVSRSPDSFIASFPQFSNLPGVRFVSGDVLRENIVSLDSTVGDIDAIIHAAALLSPYEDDDKILDTATEGTKNIILLAKRFSCRKILFTSSGAIYGSQESAVDETAPCNPITPYGKGKLIAERMLEDSGLDVKLARCFAFVGPHLNRRIYYAIGNFMQNCIDGKSIVINGDGTPLRSYLYADDLVEWLFAILERGENGRPYNVGSDYALSIRELAEMVRSVLGSKSEIVVKCKPTPGAIPSVYVPIVDRAVHELNLKVKVGLEQAILQSI